MGDHEAILTNIVQRGWFNHQPVIIKKSYPMLFAFDLRGRTPNLTQGLWMSRLKHFPSASYPSISWGRHGHQRSGAGGHVGMLPKAPQRIQDQPLANLCPFLCWTRWGAFFCFCQENNWKVLLRWKTHCLGHFWIIFSVYLPWLVLFEGCGYAAANSATRKEKPQDLFFYVLSEPGSTIDIHECISNPKKDFVNGRSWAKRKYIWNSKDGFYFTYTPKTSTIRRNARYAYFASTFTLLLDFCVFGWKLFVTFLWWPSNPFNG